jgi:hypothetical protein
MVRKNLKKPIFKLQGPMFSQKTTNLLEGIVLDRESARNRDHKDYPIELPPENSVTEMDSDIELSS